MPVALYTYSQVIVWETAPGGTLRTLRGGTVTVRHGDTDAVLFTVVADEHGQVDFVTTDVPTVTLESPSGLRRRVTSQDAVEAAATFVVSEDAGVAGLVASTTSATRAQLDGLYETKVDASAKATVAPAPTGGDDRAALQAFLDANTGKTVRLRPGASYQVNGSLIPGADTRIDMQGALLTQTGRVLPLFNCTNIDGFTLMHGRLQGKGDDYVDTGITTLWAASTAYAAGVTRKTSTGKYLLSTVAGTSGTVEPDPTVVGDTLVDGTVTWRYQGTAAAWSACVIRGAGTSRDLRLIDCDVVGFAGGSVYLTGTVGVEISDCTIEGVGGTYAFVAGVSKDNAGMVIDGDAKRISIHDNRITAAAQGILCGNVTDLTIDENTIYDIGGQHGIYTGTASRYAITGNIVDNPTLEGLKIQIGTTTSPDADTGAITGNVITRCGSHGIHLAQTAGGAPRHRNVTVTGNTVTIDAGAGGDGIRLEYTDEAVVTGNRTRGGRNGVHMSTCAELTLTGNRARDCTDRGFVFSAVSDSEVVGNRARDVATANGASTEFGFHVSGASPRLRFVANRTSDAGGNMRYGLYLDVTAADQATMELVGNHFAGATDYGARLVAGASVGRWLGNTCTGTTGAILNPPSNYATNPNTSGATLAALETEVNELKAALRAAGVIHA